MDRMEVQEHVLSEVVSALESAPDPDHADVAWFTARQPGIVRYLASRCGDGTEAMTVALLYACAVHGAYEATLGVPPARVVGSLLERAERAVIAEAETGGPVADGIVSRQPALAELCAGVAASPPIPLDERDATRVGLALVAIVYALDELATGRPVP